jgi:HAD superfamily hydrolase (TIGR01450 family)
MKIYNNILELADKFDTFLFDAYGVFWDGSEFYDGSRENMQQLKRFGKKVYILSNTTQLSSDAEDSYGKRGLNRGVHYDNIFTSGEVTRYMLISGILNELIPNVSKVYQFGTPDKKLFGGTNYKIVDNLKEADFIYISVPKLTEDEYSVLKDKYGEYLFESESSKEGARMWNSTIIEPFSDKIKQMLDSGLPVLNANPDYTASEGVNGQKIKIFAIRQGGVAEVLRQSGAKVVEFGKPSKIIYNYVFDKINILDKSRICMVGDTLRTDIKGANNAEIASVLCVETGVTANEIAKGKILEDLIKIEQVTVDYAIRGVGFNNK